MNAICDLLRNGMDTESALVASDALEDSGRLPEAEILRGADAFAIVGGKVMLLRDAIIGLDAIVTALGTCNGRRRERTLTEADVLDTAWRALNRADGWAAIGGGFVANCYGYRAVQTVCVAAVRTDGRVRVGVAVQNASKGSSLTTTITGLNKRATPEQFRQWADAAN